MATPSSSDGRGRRTGLLEEPPPELPGEARDWAELPWDALEVVLHRLDHVDILMGAGLVCGAWRRATRNEPELWRRIDMRSHAGLSSRVDLHEMARTAVRRSAGRCEAFWGEGVGDEDFLVFLGETAPSLKSLRLISCNNFIMSDSILKRAITKFTLLEELELSLCSNTFHWTCENSLDWTCDAVSESCPHLKRLRLSKDRFYRRKGVDDREAMGIAAMRGLRSLQLFANSLGNDGLAAILDNCVYLESLDIRHCFNVEMDDEEIRAKCARVKTVRLPGDSMNDYDLRFDSPEMELGSMSNYRFRGVQYRYGSHGTEVYGPWGVGLDSYGFRGTGGLDSWGVGM